jgi:hypothetical protein
MSKISHVVIENVLYDVNKVKIDTLAEFVVDVPKAELDKVLTNPRYKDIKKVKEIKI